jgi:hypothetical protein
MKKPGTENLRGLNSPKCELIDQGSEKVKSKDIWSLSDNLRRHKKIKEYCNIPELLIILCSEPIIIGKSEIDHLDVNINQQK